MSSKVKLSISLSSSLVMILDQLTQDLKTSKSALIEQAVKEFTKKQLEKEAKALAKMSFADLPSEDEWLALSPNAL